MADIKIIDELTGKEIKREEKPIVSQNSIGAPADEGLLTDAVCEVMGLESRQDKVFYRHKIDTLIAWAKAEGRAHGVEDFKSAIRRLEIKLGAPPLAERKINYVSRYAYLLMENKIKEHSKSL